MHKIHVRVQKIAPAGVTAIAKLQQTEYHLDHAIFSFPQTGPLILRPSPIIESRQGRSYRSGRSGPMFGREH